jgi:hypothetical protein
MSHIHHRPRCANSGRRKPGSIHTSHSNELCDCIKFSCPTMCRLGHVAGRDIRPHNTRFLSDPRSKCDRKLRMDAMSEDGHDRSRRFGRSVGSVVPNKQHVLVFGQGGEEEALTSVPNTVVFVYHSATVSLRTWRGRRCVHTIGLG